MAASSSVQPSRAELVSGLEQRVYRLSGCPVLIVPHGVSLEDVKMQLREKLRYPVCSFSFHDEAVLVDKSRWVRIIRSVRCHSWDERTLDATKGQCHSCGDSYLGLSASFGDVGRRCLGCSWSLALCADCLLVFTDGSSSFRRYWCVDCLGNGPRDGSVPKVFLRDKSTLSPWDRAWCDNLTMLNAYEKSLPHHPEIAVSMDSLTVKGGEYRDTDLHSVAYRKRRRIMGKQSLT